ncbi:MAG: hypothetical protein AAF620_05975 [Bacteroidota bacterium]
MTKTKIAIFTTLAGINLNLIAQTMDGSAESALLQATSKETLILRGETTSDNTKQSTVGITWQFRDISQETAHSEKKWSIYQSEDGNVFNLGGYYNNNSSVVPTSRIKINNYTSGSADSDGNITFYTYDFKGNTDPRQSLQVSGASGQVIIGKPNTEHKDDSTSVLIVNGSISATGSISSVHGFDLENVNSIDYGETIVRYDSNGRRLLSAKNPNSYINGGWYTYEDENKLEYYRKLTHGGHPTLIGSNLYVLNSDGTIQKSSADGTTKVIPASNNDNDISKDILKKARLFVEKAIWSEDYFISDKSMLADSDSDHENGSPTDHANGGGQPDYVFYEDYDLPTLEKLEQYVKTNHHLPNVPSVNDIKEKGYLSLISQTTGTLKNLEEQVLHNIAQEKKIALHEERIRSQEQRLEAQEKLINSLITRIEKLETNQK